MQNADIQYWDRTFLHSAIFLARISQVCLLVASKLCFSFLIKGFGGFTCTFLGIFNGHLTIFLENKMFMLHSEVSHLARNCFIAHWMNWVIAHWMNCLIAHRHQQNQIICTSKPSDPEVSNRHQRRPSCTGSKLRFISGMQNWITCKSNPCFQNTLSFFCIRKANLEWTITFPEYILELTV